MAIDDIPEQRPFVVKPDRGWVAGMTVIAVVVALLVIGEIVTLSKMSSMKAALEASQLKSSTDLGTKVDQKLSDLEQSNRQMIEALKDDLSNSEQRAGMTQAQLQRARATVAKLSRLEDEQTKRAEELRTQLAQKADAQQVGALGQDLSATKNDLGDTKKNVATLKNDLGMARSELGTLIATNHNDVETLRKLGERNYYEFTLEKKQQKQVAGVTMVLKKTNAKHQTFNVDMLVNDHMLQKRNRTIDEPIVFSPDSSKKYYEFVANSVSSDKVTGYISTPKSVEVATARSEGAQQ